MTAADLTRAATEARRALAAGLVDPARLARLYARYADVGDTRAFVRRARRLFPLGNCGLASLYLRDVVGTGAIVRGRYHDHPHTFLALDGLIADLTADQFGGPAVHVGPLRPPWALAR